MAGIGFELKRLFSKKSIASKLAGVFHSVFSTVGHMLIIVALLIAIHIMLLDVGIDDYYKELFSCAILYAFVFPLIFSSGINMVMSRYLADNIYNEQYDKLLPSMFGSCAMYLMISVPIGLLFYLIAPIDSWFKLGAYALYIETGLVFSLMVFVSALKKYRQISISFFIGITVAGVLSYFIIYKFNGTELNKITLLIYAFALGMAVVMTGILLSIRKHFRQRSNNYFDFLLYMKRYPMLFFANFVYTLGLYVHNFIFWLNPATQNKVATYIYSADYDMATFLGMLTILPATVIFVVQMETSFFTYYKSYLTAVNSATGEIIKKAKSDMQRSIWQEFIQLIEIQAVISLFLIVVGLGVLPYTGMSSPIIEMYPFLACGYFFAFMMFLTTTLLMYFENSQDAFKVSVIFLVSNVIFTTISVLMGSDFYGLGLIASGAVSFIAAFDKLRHTINRIDYILFCSQSLRQNDKVSTFEHFIAFLDGKRL